MATGRAALGLASFLALVISRVLLFCCFGWLLGFGCLDGFLGFRLPGLWNWWLAQCWPLMAFASFWLLMVLSAVLQWILGGLGGFMDRAWCQDHEVLSSDATKHGKPEANQTAF